MFKGRAPHALSRSLLFFTLPINTRRSSSLSPLPRPRTILLLSPNNNNYNSASGSRRRCWSYSSSSIMGSLSASDERMQYPAARRDDSIVDDYHGVKVADPYRWLEDPDAEEVKEFVQNQVELTDSVLKKCDTREKLSDAITKLFDHPRYDTLFREGDKYFYFHNTGLQAHSVLYMLDDLNAEPEVLLDPNTLSGDGTVALNTFSVSEDAKWLAYGLSSSGSDWVTIKVMSVEDKKVEPDILSWVKFSGIAWTYDSKGFFYSRYPAPKEGENIDAGTETNANLYHELYYHFLGTDQSQDILCWRDHDNPKYLFGANVTDDGKYLIMDIAEGCDPVNKVYYCDLSSIKGGLEGFRGSNSLLPFVKLIDTFDAQYSAIANDETVFTFLTNKNAPKYKLVRVDLKEPSKWFDVIGEHDKDVLSSACAVNTNQLVVSYLSDVKHILQIRDLKSGSLLHQLPLDIGSVSGVFARLKDSSFFFSFTSFLTPGVIYKCDLATEAPEVTVFREIAVPDFDRAAFQVTQVFYPSKDGTKIPMFIVAKKGIELDGSHPCLLYAYGGFNISITPFFSVSRIVLSRHLGTVFCFANLRGGGEYGEEWHKAGALAKKQTCFDDFISGAEYLVTAGYTQPGKLCIEGGSNGGLLIGACINQRPDLFGCALAHVGVMDMLRFHKFTIGHAWTSEYGCSDKEDEFHWLIKYSPLHNVKRPWEEQRTDSRLVQYPPTMLLTADHDDRVVPLHSLKFLATMQYELCMSLDESPQTNPIVGRIEVKAGHGAGRSTQKMIEEAADRYAFMAKTLGASWID
ncbi:PREDICTED: prolyl endopeptidase-like isoform X2 [Tarenaya hassleriana]|uniref:prolyl endopeptidase-like isoform X2 n=1 Tax=Tarenaya hassleriana TaxID=28532 RepID=UPI00053C5F03|nr:PREDICTED: prolyl endopeptidase-like isoform X2 [Tarenaya hassleriana]